MKTIVCLFVFFLTYIGHHAIKRSLDVRRQCMCVRIEMEKQTYEGRLSKKLER